MRPSALLVIIGIATASPAAAQTWMRAATSGDAPVRVWWLVDTDSIQRNGDSITLTMQSIFENTTDARNYDRSVLRREGSCTALSSTILEDHYYLRGTLVEHNTTRGPTVVHKPGTVMNHVMAAACGLRQYQAGPYADPETTMRGWFRTNPN